MTAALRQPKQDWWTRKGTALADAISDTLKVMEVAQRARTQQIVTSARLYGNLPAITAGSIAWAQAVATQTALRDRLSFNVIQSAVDTIVSKIAKNKPRPHFLTSGGNHEQQRKAKKLNRFVEGIFYEGKAYELGPLVFRDGCVWGDGLIHVFARDERVCFERVPESEIWVDEVEGFYGTPRQMHRVINVDRAVLKALSPKGKASVISDANPAEAPPSSTPYVADAVQVRESWRLPSGPDAGDGRHAITIAGETLVDEAWTHPWFPFARFQWCPRLYGYWSQGLAEQLQPIQIEINKLLWTVSEAYRLAGMSVIFLENGSKVVKSHLTNMPGTIVNYTGNPPQYATPNVLPNEVYGHLERLKASAYEQAGISMLSAASAKPAGLNSGKALREYNDIESDRFQTIGHAYENLFLDLAKLAIATAKDIAAESGGYPVRVADRGRALDLDWSEIDLDESDYVMQCFPVSSLPNEPAGRFQTVQEWVQAGWYTPRQGKKLMNFPDLEAVDSLEQSAEDWLTHVLDKIVDEGDYTPPDSFDDLQLGYELALEYYQQGKLNGLADERLEMLRRFMDQIEAAQAAGAVAADPGMAANTDPNAVPEAPPVSDMLPNAPQAGA